MYKKSRFLYISDYTTKPTAAKAQIGKRGIFRNGTEERKPVSAEALPFRKGRRHRPAGAAGLGKAVERAGRQRPHGSFARFQIADAFDGGGCGGGGGRIRDFLADGFASNHPVALLGKTAQRRVDQQFETPHRHVVGDVGMTFVNLQNRFAEDALFEQERGRSAGGGDFKPERLKRFDNRQNRFAVFFVHGNKNPSPFRQAVAGRRLRFGVRLAEGGAGTDNLSGTFHFRPQQRIDVGKAVETENRLFHRPTGHAVPHTESVCRQTLRFEIFAFPDADGGIDQIDARGFRDERNGPAGARVHFQNVKFLPLRGKLNVEEASRITGSDLYGGKTQALSPEWTPAASMCCIMPAM